MVQLEGWHAGLPRLGFLDVDAGAVTEFITVSVAQGAQAAQIKVAPHGLS